MVNLVRHVAVAGMKFIPCCAPPLHDSDDFDMIMTKGNNKSSVSIIAPSKFLQMGFDLTRPVMASSLAHPCFIRPFKTFN